MVFMFFLNNSSIQLPIKDFQCEIINGDLACRATWLNVTPREQCCGIGQHCSLRVTFTHVALHAGHHLYNGKFRIYLHLIMKMTQIDVYSAGGCCQLRTF